jgi:hypothetical protein
VTDDRHITRQLPAEVHGGGPRQPQSSPSPTAAVMLTGRPAPLFLDVLEDAHSLTRYSDYLLREAVSRIFGKRSGYYCMDDFGRVQWQGDLGTYTQVLDPALDALATPRSGERGRSSRPPIQW